MPRTDSARTAALRSLPSIDALLRDSRFQNLPRTVLTRAARSSATVGTLANPSIRKLLGWTLSHATVAVLVACSKSRRCVLLVAPTSTM